MRAGALGGEQVGVIRKPCSLGTTRGGETSRLYRLTTLRASARKCLDDWWVMTQRLWLVDLAPADGQAFPAKALLAARASEVASLLGPGAAAGG